MHRAKRRPRSSAAFTEFRAIGDGFGSALFEKYLFCRDGCRFLAFTAC
jgi:hypothetical protein